jgi:glycosyltransferase involved in cell wall biosynthesis
MGPTAQLATPAAKVARALPRRELARAASAPEPGIVFCHFTVAHSSLKSRSYHRLCLPLSLNGCEVKYVSPAVIEGLRGRVEFVKLRPTKSAVTAWLSHISLLRPLLRQRADIYHFQDPQLIPLALLLKLAFGKRVIYDAYEDFPSMAEHKSSWPRPIRRLAATLIRAAESAAVRNFDAALTADPFTLRRLSRYGRSRKLVFYNFPNLDFFPPPRANQSQKRFDLVYRGGLSERAGTYVLLDAIQRLVKLNRPMRVLFIGYADNAAAEQHVRARIADLGLTAHIELRGRIPHDDMAAALAEARVGISPLQDVPKFRLNIPVKIFEYWACGLPVIASDLPPSATFVRNSDAGLLFPPGDSSALACAIGRLLDHPSYAETMGKRGRAIVEQRLNNSGEILRLISLCRDLLGGAAILCAAEVQNA